jgi:hypothetical protein
MAVQGLLLLAVGALAEVTGPRLPVAICAALALLLVPVLVATTPRHPDASSAVPAP